MNTNPQVTSSGGETDSEPPSDRFDSGNLDSDFFCELNDVTTQLPSKSGGSNESVPFNYGSTPGQDGIEDHRTEIPPHKKGKNKALLLTGLVSVPMIAIGFMMLGGNSEPAKIVEVAAETAPPKTKADFALDPRFAVAQSKLAMQQQEQQLLAASRAQQQNEAGKSSVPPATATNPAPVTVPQQVESQPVAEPMASSAPTNVQPPILPAPTPTPVPIKIEPQPRVKPVETATKPVVKPVEIATKPVVKPVLVASRGTPTTPKLSPSPAIKSASTPVPTTVTPQLSWKEATNGAVEVFGARR